VDDSLCVQSTKQIISCQSIYISDVNRQSIESTLSDVTSNIAIYCQFCIQYEDIKIVQRRNEI